MRIATTAAVLLAAVGVYRPGCGGRAPSASPVCEAAAYDPCAGKACGDDCSTEGCGPAFAGRCDADGNCVAAEPKPACGAAYDPCAGKACGERCALCPPHQPGCVETAELKACDAAARCVAETPALACPQ